MDIPTQPCGLVLCEANSGKISVIQSSDNLGNNPLKKNAEGALYRLTGYSLAKKKRFWREINPPPLKQYSLSSEQVVPNKYFHHKEKVIAF
jgi:hypothetical protein